jgi:hypothetical protein
MFRSFLYHHQVHKEVKYAKSNKIILVRNGIPLSLHCYIKHYKIPLRTKIILLHFAYFSSLWT